MIYLVESYNSWHLVNANSKGSARQDARDEYLAIKNIRTATIEEIEYYISQKGEISEASDYIPKGKRNV